MRKNSGSLSWRSDALAAVSGVFTAVVLAVPVWLAGSGAVKALAVASAPRSGMLAGPENASASAADAERSYWGGLVAAMNPALTAGEARDIGRAITRYSGVYGLPPGLIVAIIRVESNGNLFAASPKGAQGLMQVMPFWKRELGIEGTLFDIDTNIRAGCQILAGNIGRWGYREGIARYYRGNLPVSGDGYFMRVEAAIQGLG